MQNWLNFFLLTFWVVMLIILLNINNLINTLIFAEILWVTLYSAAVLAGGYNDDLVIFSLSFFILSFATIDFCIGFLIIIIFRYFFKTIEIENSVKYKETLETDKKTTFVRKYTII